MDEFTKKPATIEDVAKIAGVSIATVSRAISKPDKVAESTKKKVMSAIARTGYIANAMAQNLRKQRSQMVLVLAQSIADSNFPGLLIGLEKTANERGYGVLIGNTESDVELEAKYLRFLSTGIADGMILLTGHLPVAGWPRSQASTFPPMVTAMRPVDHDEVNYVGIDDVNSYKMATEYLISLGHQDIAYIAGSQGDVISELRYEGYKNALLQRFGEKALWNVSSDGTAEGGRAAVERLFIRDTLPTAFACFNDDTAIGVISALQSRGFNVPKDFSVIGFDDIPFSNHFTPSITTIRQPRAMIGKIAMTRLLDSIMNRSQNTEITLLHGELVVRNSCSTPRQSALAFGGSRH
ncbi:MAG: LacI family DNA-binding transcriptional regulator [OCS116 cluster bacterium]|uniref:LacI family transcriptional regulator n=1 Tax=OCS116 cluster bacterium TaxID=2030921 RepID=A0A2A4YRB6_9PROT|nr:LacI family DNA-binding transcriptional regulator [OCS116 cluster bacterium]